MLHLGTVTVDVAYGGMFYVIADAKQFGLRLTPDEGGDIVRIGEMIKAAAKEQCPVVHPEQPGFDGVTIAQLSGPPLRDDADWQNCVVVSTGELDWNKPSTWTGAIDRSSPAWRRTSSIPMIPFPRASPSGIAGEVDVTSLCPLLRRAPSRAPRVRQSAGRRGAI